MSGHSKWSTIKRQKGVNDAKRGQAFTKVSKLLTIAASSGDNPETNFKLRLAIEEARAINMPKDNIERAISRASGNDPSKKLEEVIYEGYGPAGVAVIIEVVTDNKMRTASQIRSILERSGGSLAGPGSVVYNFKSVGMILVNIAGKDPDELFLLAADSGVEDIENSVGESTVYCKPEDLVKVKETISNAGYEITSAEVIKEATNTIKIADADQAKSVLNLVERLEDSDDVQKVYANFDINTDVMEKVVL